MTPAGVLRRVSASRHRSRARGLSRRESTPGSGQLGVLLEDRLHRHCGCGQQLADTTDLDVRNDERADDGQVGGSRAADDSWSTCRWPVGNWDSLRGRMGACGRELTVAAVQPPCTAPAVWRKAEMHAAAVPSARSRVVVFPELSLTGYELTAVVVEPDDSALAPMVAACAATGSLALVGAPVQDDNGRRIVGPSRA